MHPIYSPQKIESEIFKFWNENKIYEKVKAKGGKKFYFLDGPPYTTGRIHLGTAWNKIIKDTILRYLRMRGYDPTDTPGWDMHGLPIEVKVEKELGFKSKRDIEDFGVEEFVKKCMEYALKNKEIMMEQFKSLGIWMDWNRPYMTIKAEYMNSAWFTIKKAYERGLLEKKLRVVNWCPRCETALADAEIEYVDRVDPSIYVKFPVKGEEKTYLVVWTTTPWTIPANISVAVNPEIDYAKFKCGEEFLIMAKNSEKILKQFEIVETFKGSELKVEYEHPLAEEVPKQKEFEHRVYAAEFVTAENTGCVHIAPAHGEEDFDLALRYNLPIFNPVDERGVYNEDAGKYRGLNVFDANKIIINDLHSKGLILHEEKIVHRYGHCWRCKSPIIYRATEQWFIKITALKEKMLEEIEKVRWIPSWAGSSRFRDWIINAKDWCISRQRYWGIPIPVWICEKCGKMKVVGSIKEVPWEKDLDLHRPKIDLVTFECECKGIMKRVPDVFDVWFDSGVAGWGMLEYPLKDEPFKTLFPADFITEGHDQTRGWFYSQLGASVISFDKAPYRSVLMHGFTLDEIGRKMSKSLGNVVEPEEVVEKIGVDGFRIYMLSSAPWEDLRFSWDAAKKVDRMLNIFWNTVRFAYTYMSLDKFKPRSDFSNISVEDRWILSRLEKMKKEAIEAMEDFQLHKVVKVFFDFVIEDFSRWYIQLIRAKVWEERDSVEKISTYETIFRVIDHSIRVIAPFAPFISEWIYQKFVKAFRNGKESIFLEEYPSVDEKFFEDELERKMEIVKKIFEVSSAIRNKAKRKLRWPLREMVVETRDEEVFKALKDLEKILKAQCNVKSIKVTENFEKEILIKPNFKVLGPILKDKMKDFIKYISEKRDEKIVFEGIEIPKEGLIIEYRIPKGYEFEKFERGTIYLKVEVDEELMREAYAREIVRRIQEMRKELDLKVEEYIKSYLEIDRNLVIGWEDYIKRETRSLELLFGEAKGYVKDWEIDELKFRIGIERWS
ncbi:MAG: isoleucine--tRNA ligase [Archaeoglobaceae archaeon]|nr:isoleucine--tRNA ligase [Archaeoglobaceae archaeon]MCX8151723.1 isoleucine--tRNA ligase [Archaeoglobaceae archaeon]MDW8013852.1 isoleucine--tRNA ligase [Archaeoglobaceae archaeon]